MTTLTIGKVAQRATVGIETVRFYEREGLIDHPPRGPSGYRHYPESVVPRLLFIKRAKELGFTLNEIKELLSLRLDPDTTCADVKQRAERKIADVEEKLILVTTRTTSVNHQESQRYIPSRRHAVPSPILR